MPHAPETYGLAAYAYLCALIVELQEIDPHIHDRALKRAIDNHGDKPRLADQAIVQALRELA